MQSKVPLNHSALPKNMHLSPQNILWSVTLNITGYLFSCASFPFQIYSVGTNLSMTIICRKKKKTHVIKMLCILWSCSVGSLPSSAVTRRAQFVELQQKSPCLQGLTLTLMSGGQN